MFMAPSTMNASEFSPNLHAQVSDNFRLLSAAASKAQEAASRFEIQTTNLLTARSLLSRRDVADTPYIDRDSYLPSNVSSATSDISESHRMKNEDGNIQDHSKTDRDEVQSLNHQKSSDLGLEDTSSDPTANQASSAPPGHTKPISEEGGRVRRSLSESSAPRTRDLAIQLPHHKIPKPVAKWINGGKVAASEREVTPHANSIYESTGPKETPKPRSSQSQPLTALKTTRGASGTPRQTSHPLLTPLSIPGVGKTTSRPSIGFNIQNLSQSITARLNTGPISAHDLANDLAFIQVFKELVYPCIKASAQRYRGRISGDILYSIGKDVSDL